MWYGLGDRTKLLSLILLCFWVSMVLLVSAVYGRSDALRPSLYYLRWHYEEFVNKRVIVQGYAKLSWTYDCGYEGEEQSYFAVLLQERQDRSFPFVIIMFLRSKNKKLLEFLEGTSFEHVIEVESILLEKRYKMAFEGQRNGCFTYTGEGLSWRKIK
jgi:hypothetical protein